MIVRLWSLVLAAALSVPATAGASPKSEGLPIYSVALLEQTIQQWEHRDGGLGRELSDYWCDFAIRHPEEFMTTFGGHEAVFDQWLAELSNLSFTEIGGCVDRECLRAMLKNSVELAELGMPHAALAKRLSARLEQIHVRKVD
jgi:hypothetical protein